MSSKTGWQQADLALDQLLDLPPAERGAALDAMALTDEVRTLVEQLLVAHDRESDILDHPWQSDARQPADDTMSGRYFGPWVIEREIGRGGMAVVYRAHHHQQPERVAALKLVTLGALAGAGIERFGREQSILARLSHPHIVPLFDSGSADDGTPWLTMALVDGERIDRWCEAQALDTRERVRLFLDVCDAVNYAHQNLVVHRDIKPSNVLVDTSGQVRLLDFGIARLADETGESTASVYRALTPGYAAPEQFAGAPAATTMDVYGLGALLHAMLMGSPPRRGADSAPADQAGMPAASTSLLGDLGAIIQCALAIEPASRYASVAALRLDLDAWLDNRPVAAQHAGPAYRARKFVIRHRLGLSVSALLLLSLIAGTVATYWQYRRALESAVIASSQAQRATAVRDFLVGLFNAPDPERAGGAIDTQTAFRRGVEQLNKSDGIEPAARMDLLNTIARVQRTMTWYDDAATTYDAAIALGRAHVSTLKLVLVEAIYARGILRCETNRLSGSEADFTEALSLLRTIDADESRRHQVSLLAQWAQLDSAQGQPARALQRLDQADVLAAATPDVPLQALVSLLATRGAANYELGRYQAALQSMQKALALQRRDGNADNGTIAQILSWLSGISTVLNRREDALAYDREGVAVARAAYPAEHPLIGSALSGYGDSLRAAGRFEEALAQFDQAIAILAKAKDRRGTLVLTQLARTRALIGLGRYADVARDVAQVRPSLETELGISSMTAVQLSEQEVTALAELDSPDLDRAIAHARRQLDGLGPDLIAQPVAQSLRWCIADVLLDRDRGAESAAWRADLERRAANAPDNPSMRVRIAAQKLRVAVRDGGPEVARQAATLATTLDAATAASVESRAYGWLAVADAAGARGAAALHARSIKALHALTDVQPLPQALARRVESTKSTP
jgi:tetratricopeptide (TPR) repeat protein